MGDFGQYKDFDLLIGGSPCTYWSVAQKADRRETTSEGFGWELFKQYVRAKDESGCKYFLYENNYSMSDAIKNEITKHLGVEPIMIDSSLLSAQMRKRYYWTNIPNVTVPHDKGILLSDIIESGKVDRNKSLCLARRYAGFCGVQSYLCRRYFGKSFGQAVIEGEIEEIKQKWQADPYFESTEKNIRQMTVKECERLQTLPDDYTNVDGVSTKMRYESIGNGWTVDVIAHILTFLK
jgi:site-specific DNA-cytosine methylase